MLMNKQALMLMQALSKLLMSFFLSVTLSSLLYFTHQIMSEDEQMDEQMASPTSPKKPIQLVLDSDEEDVDEETVDEEPETQPYDQDCHLANSEVYVTFMLIVLPLKDSYF